VDAPHVFYNDVQTYSFFTTQIVLIPGEQKWNNNALFPPILTALS
jgi:hypothetical protein